MVNLIIISFGFNNLNFQKRNYFCYSNYLSKYIVFFLYFLSCSDFLQANNSLLAASSRSSASNLVLEDIDGNFVELNDKVTQ